MIIADVKLIFKTKIKGGYLILDDGSSISVEDFFKLFSIANACTYTALTAIDNGLMGYGDFFDTCKLVGILV